MSETDAKSGFNYRGVRFRTWLYFTLFSCALLTFMCAMQMIIFRAYYQSMKVDEMQKLVHRIDSKYGSDELIGEIHASAFVSGAFIYVFETDGTKVVNYVDSMTDFGRPSEMELPEGAVSPEGLLNEMLMTAVSKLGDKHSTYYADTLGEQKTTRLNYVELRKHGGNTVYYLLQSPYSMADFSTSILLRQLLIAIAISLILSLMLSYVLARHLAKPLTNITASARKLAAGDYNVKFEACGYAEIDDLAATLNKATEEIKTSDSLRKDLIANTSHDLRTPLTMIKAYAEMIRDLSGDKPQKREEHLNVILDETDRLSALVTDILDLSKIQAGTEVLEKTVFNLSAMVQGVATRFDGIFVPQGYTLAVDIDHDLYVVGDAKRIGQIVYNLIANALNYVGEDKQVLVSLKEEGNRVTFRVQDHGKGIEQKDQEHIWDRYFRSAEAKRTKVGSGIGLSIVKGVCVSHGLRYGVTSVVGSGSTFYVIFNKVEPSAPATPD